MILITGASGFLGRQIKDFFGDQHITAIGRSKGDIIADLSKEIPVLPNCNMVIHAAGKAHSVPKTAQEKQEFFDVNVTGTQNLLKGLEQLATRPQSFVFISTVAVYGLTCGRLIDEHHPLLATDPYGLSKINAENIIEYWCKTNHVKCVILRLPLLAGPHPPGNLGSMLKGIKKGYYFNIAGGGARKSMVLAEDVTHIIYKASTIGGIYNLTDGYHPSFYELSLLVAKQLNKRIPFNIPYAIAKLMALAGDIMANKSPINSDKLKKITTDLTFDDSKARKLLAWDPTPVLKGLKIN